MERDQLFLAAKEEDIATIETLIYVKYIDVNSRTGNVCMYSNHMVVIYACTCKISMALKA